MTTNLTVKFICSC